MTQCHITKNNNLQPHCFDTFQSNKICSLRILAIKARMEQLMQRICLGLDSQASVFQFLVVVTTIPFSKTSQPGMKPIWLSIIWDCGLRDTGARKGRRPRAISDFRHNILRSELFWNFTQHTMVVPY